MKLDPLLLFSGNDIPFSLASITIHHPTLKEIAYLGEDDFFTGYQMLIISKNILAQEDKVNLETLTNFDILIAILRERNAVMQKNRNCIELVLSLLFPGYEILFQEKEIVLKKDEEQASLNSENFDEFQSILKQMFSFGNSGDVPTEFNPDGAMAARIAEKLKKRHQTLAQQKKSDDNIDIIGRYVSVLATGLSIEVNSIMNYTIYQLFDQIKRYELKTSYDIFIKSKLAGAQDVKEPED